MTNYTIITDTGSDVTKELAAQWNVCLVPLVYYFEDDIDTLLEEAEPEWFYAQLAKGRVARTSGINTVTLERTMRAELEQGRDVLYITLSSGLSGTYGIACNTAEELAEEFPDRKICICDSLSATAGQALVVYLTAKARDNGMNIDENFAYAKDLSAHLAHWFTVDDLMYLYRGGRLSAVSAIAGSMLSIKPLLHVDSDGKLVNMAKCRGRQKALKSIFDKYCEKAIEPESRPYFLIHSLALEDAKSVEAMIEAKYGKKAECIIGLGPIIGAHTGPGLVGCVFEASDK